VWEDLARENKKCRIQVLNVNLDIKEYWEKDERERIINILSSQYPDHCPIAPGRKQAA
jgi:hypothetical protein